MAEQKDMSAKQANIPNTWIFNMQSTASLLIALGGFCKAMVDLGCLPGDLVYRWAESCFFVFQLPVFYFGYGYLFQKQWRVRNRADWCHSMKYHAVYMLVPLVFITFFTLLINSWVGANPSLSLENLINATFVNPVIPVGFFLVALVMYALTPTFATQKQMIGFLIAALTIKILAIICALHPATAADFSALPYVVQNFCGSWIWFIGGMTLAWQAEEKTRTLFAVSAKLVAAVLISIGWLILSVLLFALSTPAPVLSAVLTATGLFWFTVIFGGRFGDGAQVKFYAFIDRYTKAIWLLHPMFMKSWFYVLSLAGVQATGALAGFYVPAHVIGGLVVVYVLPIGVLWMMNHVGKLGFLVNPNHYFAPKDHS